MNAESTNTEFPNLVSIVPMNGGCKFDPTSLQVASGDEVTFRNQTEKTIAVTFDNQEIFDMAYLPLDPGQVEALQVKEGEGGQVKCSVRCDIFATKVVMTVAPTIIVNRD